MSWASNTDPALVKTPKRECPCLPFRKDNRGDQIAADHKKDVDARKTTAQPKHPCMIQHNRYDRKSAKAVDFWSVLHIKLSLDAKNIALFLARNVVE
jgi:hypothetical protein